MRFNPLEHILVPEHRLLTAGETDEVLKRLKVTRDQLPKIRKTDPVVRVLERFHGCVRCANMVRITEGAKAPRTCVLCAKPEDDCLCERNEKGPIEEGSVIRVLRLTTTAGVSEAYRLVIGR